MTGYSSILVQPQAFFVVIILSVLPTLSFGEVQNLQYDNKLNFVSGIVSEYLDDPIFYDTYLPLLYEFPVPKHMENALKILWMHATVCNASDSRYDGKLCPVVHHLHKVVGNLSTDMSFWKGFIPDSDDNSDDKTSSTTSAIKSPNCGEISSHFGNYYTNKDEMEKYLKSLSKCPLGTTQSITQSSTWIIDKQIYYTMVDRFYSEFYRNLPGTGNVDWVVTLNSYTTIQGILLSNNYMESNRLMNAFLSCQAGKIPNSFVKPSMLKEELKKQQEKVHTSHMKYLWDKDSDLSMYYKLPIADCTFTHDYKLLVRILIPVKSPDFEAKLLQVKTFPFVTRFQQQSNSKNSLIPPENSLKLCKLNSPASIRMIESNQGLLFESNCNSYEFCKRSDLNSYLPLDACTSAIVINNDTLVAKHCHINCYPVDQKSLPIFRRKSSDTFLAVGTSNDKIFIQCNGQPVEKITLTNVGALEIKLPCNCQISYRNLALQATDPCVNKSPSVSVKHILPFQWDMKRNSNSAGGGGENMTDENVILDSLEKEDILELKNKYHYNTVDGNSDSSDEHQNGQQQTSDKQIHVEPTGINSSSGFLIQICLLWILVVVLVGTNVFLLYHVHLLIKWKKIQVYKDTRIVYSVPASPQFPSKF